jgi:DNA-binding winged helix-turn-helix (wHTH) protein
MNFVIRDYANLSYSLLQNNVQAVNARRTDCRRQPVFRFSNFVVSPSTRSVHVDGQRINVGSRAFDLLVLLLSSPGSVVSKDEIFERVWPSTVVEESNLRVQMNQVRKALGDLGNSIVNVPGRGYLFAEDVITEWPDKAA